MNELSRAVAAVLGFVPPDPDLPLWAYGLDSLAALRIVAALSGPDAGRLSLADFFPATTMRDLDRIVAASAPRPSPPVEISLPSLSRTTLLRQRMMPSDVAGNCALVWVVHGEVDVSALTAAVASLPRRHDGLSRCYPLVGPPTPAEPSEPVVTVRPAASLEAALCDVRSALRKPFRPDRGEVFRAVVVEVEPGLQVLGIGVHHVAFDGASEAILADALGVAYDDVVNGRPGTPDVGIREALGRLARRHPPDPGAAGRWRAELSTPAAGPAAVTAPVPSGSAGPARLVRSIPVGGALRDLAAYLGVSYFVLLLAAYRIGIEDTGAIRPAVLAVPVSLRDDPGLGRFVGNLTTMVPVLPPAPGPDDLGRLARRTADSVRRALLRADLSIEDSTRVAVEAGLAGGGFQHVFVLQQTPAPRLRLGHGETRFVREPYYGLSTATMCEIWPPGQGWGDANDSLVFTYDPARFAADAAERLVRRFLDVLAELAMTGAVHA
ncbi:phosphopantetheine-binding protein [Actinoplanes subtropicus]|uniref:phosphopantetheine-binding protein n=1 Tax=Actinoplanes subtropicus TaxID=543632 RepID=UPI001470718D|nr:phosphopantetheine-binding protein [Actinoplanes subtropicus]